jgi:hypothetical protein
MTTITIHMHERGSKVWILSKVFKRRKCRVCGESSTESTTRVMLGTVHCVSWDQRDGVRYVVQTARHGVQRWVPAEDVFETEEAAKAELDRRERKHAEMEVTA